MKVGPVVKLNGIDYVTEKENYSTTGTSNCFDDAHIVTETPLQH